MSLLYHKKMNFSFALISTMLLRATLLTLECRTVAS